MTIKFTKDHEWIRVEGEVGTVGITDYAQQQLGDVVFVELPDVGMQLAKGKEAAVVESVKAASEIYSPVDGEVIEVNEPLSNEPSTVNSDPMNGAWFLKIKISDEGQLGELMDEAAYKSFVEGLG